MDVDSNCPVPTEANFLKQTKLPYRRVELCSNTKIQGANPNLAKTIKFPRTGSIAEAAAAAVAATIRQ